MLFLLLPAGVLACAGTATRMGTVSREELRAEQARQQALVLSNEARRKASVMSNVLEQEQRLLDVGYPLLRDARSLCRAAIAPKLGITIGSARAYSREWQEAARSAGISDTVTVVAVARESRAARAGLGRGDRIVAIANTPVRTGQDGVKDIAKQLSHALERDVGRTVIRVLREGAHLEIPLAADLTCDFDLVLFPDDDDIHASANGRSVRVTWGMMRFVSDDDLGTVVSHEIAHNAMRHVQSKQRNSLLAGLVGAAIDIASATQGVDTHGENTKTLMALGARIFSQDFEREADYVGMYILALNNRPLDKAAELWRRMAVLDPTSISFARTHPTTAERYIRLNQAAAEIRAKRAAGRPLIPEFKDDRELDARPADINRPLQARTEQVQTEVISRPAAETALQAPDVIATTATSDRSTPDMTAGPRRGERTFRWAGRTKTITELFTISGAFWQILYSVKAIPGFKAHVRLEVYRIQQGGSSELIFSHRGSGDGTVEIPTGPGTYYIKILPSNANWDVSVQQ